MASSCIKMFYILCAFSLVISIAIIAQGLSMRKESLSKCDTDVYPHILIEGIIMLVLTFIALIGTAWRIKFLLRVFIILTAIEFIYIIVSSTIGYQSTFTADGRDHYSDHDEYSLDHYTDNVKKRYLNDVAWESHKRCFKSSNLCPSQYDHDLSYWKTRNHVRYACCGPPLQCGYNYTNGKGFMVPNTGLASEDLDCLKYDNHAERKCFDCDICKAAYLSIEVGDMKRLNMAVIIVNVMFILQLMMACAAADAIDNIDDSDINNPMYRRYR